MSRYSRETWVDAAFSALAEGGADQVKVERLATRLGVTKGSFYHHFPDRRALHLAMLDTWEERGTTRIIDDVDATSSNPRERLSRLAHRTFAPHPEDDAIESALRAWAQVDTSIAAALARVDARRLDYTAALLAATGMTAATARRRAGYFYRMLIGEFLWRGSGRAPISAGDIDELVDLLAASSDSHRGG
ncbi:MAG: TetR/AcrR family transcriptional regulator [Dermatophilaceae bacterium]